MLTDEQLWHIYAAAAVASGIGADAAAVFADQLLDEHRKRWPRATRHAPTEAERRPAVQGI